MRSTLTLGRDLGLKIVAEGVEDEQTVGLLKRLGCDQVQGRVISGPLPAAELMTWFTAEAKRLQRTFAGEAPSEQQPVVVAVPAQGAATDAAHGDDHDVQAA